MSAWSEEQLRILKTTLSARAAQKRLAEMGVHRTLHAIYGRIYRMDLEDVYRRMDLRALRGIALGTRKSGGWSRADPAETLQRLTEDGLVERYAPTRYRATPAGIAYLVRHLGPDWEDAE